jgi:predicted O-linked N-acetylglucosamine transferase (SPINDLY family)
MDFYLSSDLMEPEDGAAHYSEKLIRLPNLARYLEPGAGAPPPKDFGLPEGRVLYGCLQSLFKYLPRYDDILPRIAAEVPKALFVFIEGMSPHMTDITRARLDAAFAKAGLSAAEHVLFLPRMGAADFEALTRRMDVLVDSLGWSGGNTTLGAIEAGVPLITCPGAFMRGRHSYAMFRMMDMPSAIAQDTDDMVRKLIALGQEPDRRQAMIVYGIPGPFNKDYDTRFAPVWAKLAGGDPARLFVAGHSAGAYNAAMLALDPRWLAEAGVPPGALAGFCARPRPPRLRREGREP